MSLGDIVNMPDSDGMGLQVFVQVNNGTIRSSTDFLYLQPQQERIQNDIHSNLFQNGGGINYLKQNRKKKKTNDAEPLPKRFRDLRKERIVLIEKNSSLCENVGTAYVNLSVERGLYKLYFLRIENEQRVMANSRLEILGDSESFSIRKKINEGHPTNNSLEDSKCKIEDTSQYENSNSWDSSVLLR